MQRVHPLKIVRSQMDRLGQMINDSLLYDWVIRVEYVNPEMAREESWQQWKAPLFALKSSQAVLDAIAACRTAHPCSPVRLNAEKLRPRTHVVYWIDQIQQNRGRNAVSANVRGGLIDPTNVIPAYAGI